MSHILFQWGEDQEYGDYGWLPAAYPNFNAVRPGGFGHDCIEHFPRGLKHGQIADELLALGARLYVRVDSGWWWRQQYMQTVPQSFGYELHRLLRDMDEQGVDLPDPGSVPLLDNEMDDEIEAAQREAVRVSNAEHDRHSDDQDEPYAFEQEQIQWMGAWLRRGYAACIKRFRGAYAGEILALSEALDRASEKFAHGEEGDRLLVRIHEQRMEFSLKKTTGYGESALVTGNV
jgi:hypothetical protein